MSFRLSKLADNIYLGCFPFSQNFRISGSVVDGTLFVGTSHRKIPRKSGKSKKVGPFSRLEFPNGISCSIYTFLVVCTSSRSTVRHCDVPGFTTKWNTFLPIGNSTFAPTEISGFFSQMESARYLRSETKREPDLRLVYFEIICISFALSSRFISPRFLKIYVLKIGENFRGKYKGKKKKFSILNSSAPSQNIKTRTSCRRLFENFLPSTATE